MILAHISDLHIGQERNDGGARALRRARETVDRLNRIDGEVDAVLVTGDLADHGLPEEYATVRELLATLRFPVLVCPGNHDDRTAYLAELLQEPHEDGPVNRVHRLAGYTIAMCDSSIPRRDEGFLDDDTLTWLDKVLAETEDPALVCFHHPPVELRVPFIDGIMLQEPGRLADVLHGHDNVRAVLCGHAHTGATTTFAGAPWWWRPAWSPLWCSPSRAMT
ncbi:metallophosphoesterase [Actinophytocola algeriensis]|uniref:3',5'-cyclic AMP phosphodiesterase CpdA n=1 Tax=Actinophytocola algeriensis TaxID=1768010 RepID=A0A7W7Q100_9PSEU|nr:metallophosphoesterase [Actinophytocola algeriensis]MBB4904960.1 3',5'-cyclic AMP phosphodiesterase CpdA [Actinophytocola algeriensis]MBE1476180.1 3',5'-cyclic AMP phosphodiesterase CpdA [Actinophytocola algeriensis]